MPYPFIMPCLCCAGCLCVKHLPALCCTSVSLCSASQKESKSRRNVPEDIKRDDKHIGSGGIYTLRGSWRNPNTVQRQSDWSTKAVDGGSIFYIIGHIHVVYLCDTFKEALAIRPTYCSSETPLLCKFHWMCLSCIDCSWEVAVVTDTG